MQPSVYKNYKFGNTQVKYLYQGSTLVWPPGPEPEHDYQREYFTIESKANNNVITLTIPSRINGTANENSTSNILNYVSYSFDKLNWTRTNVTNAGQTITVTLNNGEKVYWKGSGTTYAHSLNTGYHVGSYFGSTGNYIVYGNIASLLYEDDFINKSELPVVPRSGVLEEDWVPLWTYSGLFRDSTNLLNASNLYLPYIMLGRGCYAEMFYGCTSLTGTPDLSIITSLSYNCFQYMFRNCTSLIVSPTFTTTLTPIGSAPYEVELPEDCCQFMFSGCTSLQSPLAFPSTITAAGNGACYHMYENCTSLTTAPVLSATTAWDEVYESMFYNCTSLTSAPELPATTISRKCYMGMFEGCTSLTSVPSSLPATTLEEYCYASMFYGCTSLTSAPALPATTMALNCYASMFYGCTSLTSAPALPATTLAEFCYEWMFKGCTSLTTAPELPAYQPAVGCYYEMFYGCTSLTSSGVMRLVKTAPSHTATGVGCCQGMYEGCTNLTDGRYLNTETLTAGCYRRMFFGCTKLSSLRCRARDISAAGCTENWLKDVSNTGTFQTVAPSIWTTGPSGIPSGWTVQRI